MYFKSIIFVFYLWICIHANCKSVYSSNQEEDNKNDAITLKLIAMVSIFIAGAIGVCIPQLNTIFESFRPGGNILLAIKCCAVGVILAIGFVHVFPKANESLDNPSLGNKAWGDFPLANFVAMLAAVMVMMVKTVITNVFRNRTLGVVTGNPELQVLEIGIIIHSVTIGVALGVSIDPKVIKPLIVALSFHQMFEGMGIGSCLTKVDFKFRTVTKMLISFSLTTPIGIAIGIGIANTYDNNSHTALIVQGLLNATSAGILIYMGLVDSLALELMKSRVQRSYKLQALAFISILCGLGVISLLAKWA